MGELRRLADDLVMRTMNPQEPQQKDEPVDFFTDPDKYIEKKIQSDPRLAQLENSARAVKRNEMLSNLEKEFGKLETIGADPSFQEWVTGSKIRTELFMRADQGLDEAAARELLTTWKERSLINSTKQAKEDQEEELQRNLSAASSVKGASGASESGGKVYRRADIIRLQITDPKRYDTLLPEIRKAYTEGRVR
jgi:hypothetical protein